MVYGQSIADYKWKNRVLLLVDNNIKSQDLQSQLNLFLSKTANLEERETLIFQVTPDEVRLYDGQKSDLNSSDIYKYISISKKFSGVVLIGKDGDVKFKKPFEIKPESIFSIIDSMPMRRSEIKHIRGK